MAPISTGFARGLGHAGPLAAAMALAVLGACHRHTLPGSERCPADGGKPWREYTSRHYLVDTDLESGPAAALVADLERLRALVAAALAPEPPDIPGYVRVIVPASVRTYHAIAPRMAAGYFGATTLWEPMVVLHPDLFARDPEVIAHELAHHFAWYSFPRQPRWFHEGLAQFVQTVANADGPSPPSAGLVPRARAPRLAGAEARSAEDILGARLPEAELQLWSWVLYHWLWSERPRELSEYQRRLALGEDPSRAWVAAFPEFVRPEGLARLSAALDAHRRGGKLAPYPVHAEWSPAFAVAPLAPADVHMLLLEARAGPIAGVVRKEVAAALAEDPTQPLAIWRQATVDGASPVPALRGAVRGRAGDWRAWLLLGDALGGAEGDAGERAQAYRRALATNPGSVRAHAALGRLLTDEGRPAEALPHARRAVELWPSDPGLLATLARVVAELGACDDALSLQRRAADLLPAQGADDARRQLAAVERRCGSAATSR